MGQDNFEKERRGKGKKLRDVSLSIQQFQHTFFSC